MSNKKIGSVITTIILLAICVALAAAVIIKILQPKEEIDLGKANMAVSDGKSNVYVEEIAPTDFVQTLKFFGTASDDSDKLNIITRTSGYVSEVLVEEDDKVEEGQIIGYVDPSTPGATYKKYAVTARVNGTIETVDATVGSYVSTGSVFATEKEDPKYIVKVNLPERYIDNIHIGSRAILSSTIRSELNTIAQVTDISTTIDSSSRTIAIELTPEDSSLFLDGLALTVKMVIDEENDVFVVPTDAIYTMNEKNYVFVAVDGLAQERDVVLGANNDSETVIVSGLEKGDLVIVEGTVSEGASINIVER